MSITAATVITAATAMTHFDTALAIVTYDSRMNADATGTTRKNK